LAGDRYSVSFQSRLGGEPWCQPFTDVELARLPAAGAKRLLVMCPAFVADCLETLEEIGGAGKEIFLTAGGVSFQTIPCLNDQAPYIEFLAGRVERWLEGGDDSQLARETETLSASEVQTANHDSESAWGAPDLKPRVSRGFNRRR
jgi:protoporphyrin/coproporphyrin ferrochelatase